MLSVHFRRIIRLVSPDKVISNPSFYHSWAYRSARRISALSGDWYTPYQLEQLAEIRGFAHAVRVMEMQK